MQELAAWDSFYAIVGSAAGALIGLQFVVMTLIAQRPSRPGGHAVGAAFATPTIVHFGTVLFLAAIFRAPWQTQPWGIEFWNVTPILAGVWGSIGLGGVIYSAIVGRRMRSQPGYQPEFEDWLFHLVLPFLAYAILGLSALTASSNPRNSLFTVGGAVLLLLFVGIHNAWDAIAYHVFVVRKNDDP